MKRQLQHYIRPPEAEAEENNNYMARCHSATACQSFSCVSVTGKELRFPASYTPRVVLWSFFRLTETNVTQVTHAAETTRLQQENYQFNFNNDETQIFLSIFTRIELTNHAKIKCRCKYNCKITIHSSSSWHFPIHYVYTDAVRIAASQAWHVLNLLCS